MPVVSTGQITIIDQNDGKPITVILTASTAIQQIFTKEDTTTTYNPNWSTAAEDGGTAIVITPKIYVGKVGGVDDLSTNTVQIINRKWSKSVGSGTIYDGGVTTQDITSFVKKDGATAVTNPFTFGANGVDLTISANLKNTIGSYPIYFQGTYKDPITSLESTFIASIELNIVATGTNAIFVRFRGSSAITEGVSGTRNKIAVCADLIRGGSGEVDRSSLNYRWYDITGATVQEINTSYTGYATKFGFTDTAAASAPSTNQTTLAGILNTNVPAGTAGNTYNSGGTGTGNTIVIDESAITDYGIFRVDITDTDATKTYSGTVTVYDIGDPYDLKILSSTGDKLPNGTGSTTLTVQLYKGSDEITNFNGYSFTWIFRDRNGKRAGFVDADTAGAAASFYNGGAGRAISANTAGSPYTITFATATAPTVGTGTGQYNMVKIVKDGLAYYHEITAATTTTVTLSQSPSVLSLSDFPLPTTTTQYVGGVIYLCTLNGIRTTSGANAAAAAITVRGEDIESKGIITCQANY